MSGFGPDGIGFQGHRAVVGRIPEWLSAEGHGQFLATWASS